MSDTDSGLDKVCSVCGKKSSNLTPIIVSPDTAGFDKALPESTQVTMYIVHPADLTPGTLRVKCGIMAQRRVFRGVQVCETCFIDWVAILKDCLAEVKLEGQYDDGEISASD